MRRPLKILVYAAIAIIVLFAVGRMTGMLQYYTASSSANAPTMKVGERFFTTNLVAPARFDLASFVHSNAQDGKHTRVYRIYGLEGDVVEMRDGEVYINNARVQPPHESNAENMIGSESVLPLQEMGIETFPVSADSAAVFLSAQFINEKKIPARRIIARKNEPDEAISKAYGKPWNKDQFGPVTVPRGKYFVLGDNRPAAEDSRFIGFIDKSAINGVVLGY